MKNYLMVLISLVVFFAAFCICCKPVQAVADTNTPKPPAVSLVEPNSSAEVKTTDVVATVNGVAITEGEVETRIKPQLERIVAQGAKTPPQFIEQYKTAYCLKDLDFILLFLVESEKDKDYVKKLSKTTFNSKSDRPHIRLGPTCFYRSFCR